MLHGKNTALHVIRNTAGDTLRELIGNGNKIPSTLLALIYEPSQTLRNKEDDNATFNSIIKPVLGTSTNYLWLQLLPFKFSNNKDVDWNKLKDNCKNPSSFTVTNNTSRIEVLVEIYKCLGNNLVIWEGGPDVATALRNFNTKCQVKFYPHAIFNSVVDSIISPTLGITISPYHPSASLMAHGDDAIRKIVQHSLGGVKVMSAVLNDNDNKNGIKTTDEEDIIKMLSESAVAHTIMVRENRLNLTNLLGEENLKKVLEKKPSVLHYTIAHLLDVIETLKIYGCKEDTEIMTKIASSRIWLPQHTLSLILYLQNSDGDWQTFVKNVNGAAGSSLSGNANGYYCRTQK